MGAETPDWPFGWDSFTNRQLLSSSFVAKALLTPSIHRADQQSRGPTLEFSPSDTLGSGYQPLGNVTPGHTLCVESILGK